MKTRRGTKKQQEEISEGGGVSVCIKKFFPRGENPSSKGGTPDFSYREVWTGRVTK
jgi:hypothetical protein